MSSPSALAGKKPITAWAVSSRSATMRSSSRWASSKSSRALLPQVGFSKMRGYVPLSSQVWKKGDQSMRGTSSASDHASKTRIPMNEGRGGP
jgi:hypothetical protein